MIVHNGRGLHEFSRINIFKLSGIASNEFTTIFLDSVTGFTGYSMLDIRYWIKIFYIDQRVEVKVMENNQTNVYVIQHPVSKINPVIPSELFFFGWYLIRFQKV